MGSTLLLSDLCEFMPKLPVAPQVRRPLSTPVTPGPPDPGAGCLVSVGVARPRVDFTSYPNRYQPQDSSFPSYYYHFGRLPSVPPHSNGVMSVSTWVSQ